MDKPFTRKDLVRNGCEILRKGRWANADLYLYDQSGRAWVIKDFLPCAPLVRQTWGRMLIRREFQALRRLCGINGIAEPTIILDAFALCYPYMPGKTLREAPPDVLDEGFFQSLETLVEQMHQRNMVHLDIRNRRNVLINQNGMPALLDFQSSLDLSRVPECLHNFLKEIDISGVYKLWQLKHPESLGATRQARLAALNKKRFLWILRGYPLGTRRLPRK